MYVYMMCLVPGVWKLTVKSECSLVPTNEFWHAIKLSDENFNVKTTLMVPD